MAKKKVKDEEQFEEFEEFEQVLLDEEAKESPKVEKDNSIPDKKQRWLN